MVPKFERGCAAARTCNDGAGGTAMPAVMLERGNGMGKLRQRLWELATRRVLVLSPPSRRFVDGLVAALARFRPVVFDGARVHVPYEVVQAALYALGTADTIVAIGGGSVIGLGKAMKLERDLRFVAIPTTYSGSEMTRIWGVTRAGEKTTGRDERVRPDLVLYDTSLSSTLPIRLTVQSLLNALAHPVGALSVGSLAGEDRKLALRTAAVLVQAIEDLLQDPASRSGREMAMRAAFQAGVAIDRGKGGAQHGAAHYLGGALGLDHAALHSVLLPHFIAHLRETQAALIDELEAAIGGGPLAARVYDLLVRAGAPTSLAALGVDPGACEELLQARPDLLQKMVRDAQAGLRPTAV
jgi:maleylacetate reductase